MSEAKPIGQAMFKETDVTTFTQGAKNIKPSNRI